MEQIFPFNIVPSVPIVINPRTGNPGVLEFRAADRGTTVYLFEGTYSVEECEAQTKDTIEGLVPGWKIATNTETGPAWCMWNGQQTIFTIYAPGGGQGYVRIVEK